MTNESKLYIDNLNSMRNVVANIKNMPDLDIDKLVPLTEEGLKARNNCLERISVIENKLGINTESEQS